MALNIRELALEALVLIEKNEYSYQDALNGQLMKYQFLSKQDRGFLNRLISGTLEYKIRLDYVINKFSNVPVNKQKPLIRSLIRMSVYQILFMDSVPDSAAVNEAVKLAKKKGFNRLSGFVNGVLRSVTRERDSIEYPDSKSDEYLSVYYSMPKWIVKMVTEQYGPDKAFKMIAASLEEAPINIFVNRRKTDIDTVCETVAKEGLTPHRISPDKAKLKSDSSTAFSKGIESHLTDTYKKNALKLKGVDYLSRYDSFKDGLYTVQDVSSMLVGFLAEYLIDNKIDKDRVKVLDMCSAPGSKAMYIANVSDKVHVSSRDISEYKRDLILENVERLGVDNIDVKVSDALIFDERSEGRYDLVLLDAPCSGLGVIRRKKDIKYNLSSDQVDELVDIQKKMLKNAAEYTRLDGYLIYSTCTINKQENEYQVEEFLNEHDEYELLYEKQLLTGIDNSDGFYVALLKRR